MTSSNTQTNQVGKLGILKQLKTNIEKRITSYLDKKDEERKRKNDERRKEQDAALRSKAFGQKYEEERYNKIVARANNVRKTQYYHGPQHVENASKTTVRLTRFPLETPQVKQQREIVARANDIARNGNEAEYYHGPQYVKNASKTTVRLTYTRPTAVPKVSPRSSTGGKAKTQSKKKSIKAKSKSASKPKK